MDSGNRIGVCRLSGVHYARSPCEETPLRLDLFSGS